MTTTAKKPTFVPPKKRSAKRQNEGSPNSSRMVVNYDIITTHSRDDTKKNIAVDSCEKSSSELLLQHSPAHATPKKNVQHVFATDDVHSSSDSLIDNKTNAKANIACVTDAVDKEVVISEKSALNADSRSIDSYVTMTGTIKRGKKAGQSMDVRLNMSREELEDLEASINQSHIKMKRWAAKKGIHIVLLSILCSPIAAILSGGYSFYLGTLAWYNVYLYYNEECTIWHKICICPLLLFLYPFMIVLSSVGLAIYSALVQISWNFDRWWAEIQDFEKGFFGWLCGMIGLDDCAPYEVVILSDASAQQSKPPVEDTIL